MTTAALMNQTEKAAAELLNNPLLSPLYRTAIQHKIVAMKANPTAKAVCATLADLELIATKVLNGSQP